MTSGLVWISGHDGQIGDPCVLSIEPGIACACYMEQNASTWWLLMAAGCQLRPVVALLAYACLLYSPMHSAAKLTPELVFMNVPCAFKTAADL